VTGNNKGTSLLLCGNLHGRKKNYETGPWTLKESAKIEIYGDLKAINSF
jgi:hypothetical protein